MIHRSTRTILILFTTLLSLTDFKRVHAEEHRWTHFGLRPLGMGNAYVAIADDYNALFYNPAGLARLKTWDGEFFNPTLEITSHTLEFINDMVKFVGGGATNITDALSLIEPQLGKIHHASFQSTPHLIFKNFGFGFGVESAFNLVPHSDIDLEVDAGLRVMIPFSYARNFLEDRLSIGASLKALVDARLDDSFNIETLAVFSNENKDDPNAKQIEDMTRAGFGMGVDLGLLFTPIEEMKPTIGISITDFGGSSFTKLNEKSRNPKQRLPSVNTGFSLRPIEKGPMYVSVAVDAHMINQPIHYSHKLNFGAEWGYSEIIKVQAGLKEGYLTTGFQFDVGLLNLRFVTYHVDHGPVVGTHSGLVERRYAMQLKLFI